MFGSPAEMAPLFGVVLADLDGQNLRFYKSASFRDDGLAIGKEDQAAAAAAAA